MGGVDFSRIDWVNDREFSIDGWPFREHPNDGSGVPLETTDWFWIFKPRGMIDAYAEVFATRPGFTIDRVLELGIWAGGSVAFWSLVADPDRLAAIDISDRGDPALLQKFRTERPHVTTHWRSDQTDQAMFDRIIREDDLAPLDLVIDDASHLYGLSRRSFELLFARLRPGGLYCLEDWSWSYEPEHQSGDSPMATQRPLADLVSDFVGLIGSRADAVARVDVYPEFAVVERGEAPLDHPLSLDELIRVRHRPSLRRRTEQVRSKARRELAALRHRLRARSVDG
jgi:hypothetical protein